MNDPKRRLDSAAAGDLARSLLESAMTPGPTDEQCQAMWRSLSVRLPASVGAGHGSPGAHASGTPSGLTGAGGATVLKAVGILLLAGGLATGVLATRHRSHADAPPPGGPAAPPQVMAAATVAAPTAGIPPAPMAAEAAETTSPSLAPEAPSHASAGRISHAKRSTEQSSTPSDSLRMESRVVLEARDAIRAGDCGGALTRLDEARSRFGGGALPQEREVLSIEALDCSGRRDEARERAAAFLREYPTSPHVASLRRFVR